MPYGIQQPAVSAQILRLEEDLETVLFQRRPFRLTKAEEKLFSFIAPFFTQLDEVAAQIRGTVSKRFRLGASGPVLRNYVPAILPTLRPRAPKLRRRITETHQPEQEPSLPQNGIDCA